MPNQTLARRYATAIFHLASEQHAQDALGRELQMLSNAISENEATREFFVSPVIEREQKERTLVATLGEKISKLALHALLLLVRKRRETLLPEIVRQYGFLELAARGLEPLTVTSAKKLDAQALWALVDRLEHIYGKKFEVTQRIQPDLIGGVRLLMGDRRIDGSVEGRIAELSRTLFARN
ncbi:MAG TPA: ATP synthase F1 subunit delta [Candidatus Rubrimentiphilum sp.]|nr:ATP synthase F1 subunit delta [Candidatus Rubrimentiphilum sp.]